MSSDSPTSSRASTPVILTAAANASSQYDIVTPTADPSSSRYRFTYDPERRGPESISGTTTHGQDYFAAAPAGLGFHFGGSTVSLNLGALPNEWSSSKHGFHAISTVLNNPHKKQAPPKAHSALPSVMPAELPRVRRKDFDSYLQVITSEWEKLEKSLPSNAADTSQFEMQQTSFSSLEPLNTSRLQALNPNQPKNLPSLESVPSVFFQSDFDLGNPQTFALITDQDQFGEGDPTVIAHSLPLLEKFSHYADTVELHLSNEIAARAPSFFAALTNLHTLQSESTATLSQISRLRQMLEQVDETVAKKGMEVISLEKRVQGVKAIERSVEGVKDVVKFTGEAREKVGKGMYGDALVILGVLDDMWNDASPTQSFFPTKPNGRLSSLPPTPEGEEADPESAPPEYLASPVSLTPSTTSKMKLLPSLGIPLSQLNAFSALPSHLRSLTLEIASSLSDELVSILRDDLLWRIGNGGSITTGSGKEIFSEETKNQLTELLVGLIKTRGLKEATLSYREIVFDEFRGLIRKKFYLTLIPPRPQLATHLPSLSHPEFMSIIRAIYHDMLSGVEGLHAARQGKSSIPAPTPSSGDSTSVTSLLLAELTDTLSSATELAHTQAAQLLSSRSEIHAGLSLPEFVELFNDTWKFVVRSEVVCRRMIVGLRGAVVSQAKAFLQTFHQSRLTQSAKLVEDEQWSPQDVSLDIQTTANTIVDTAMKDPPELILRSEAAAPTSSNPKSSSILSPFKSLLRSSSTSQNGNATSTKKSKHIYVESNSFFTVPATSSVLSLLTDYLAVIINLGILTTDTMSRIIEFLKAFNSRTCQVVLGAGAMRSAGLKNITAKHLALASQSLSIMIALVPYIRETFRRHLNSKQAVMLIEFDKLKRDYQEHQHEIHAKLIAIMGDRLSAHIKSLQARTINWNVPPARGGVNDYIELLVKETVTLHKVLSRYLSAAVVEDVMSQVFAAINHRLSEEYSKIELPHAEAKSRLLEDVKFLHQKLSALKTVGKPSMMLETVVREKPIPKLPGAPPTPVRNGSMISPPNSAASNASTNQRLRGLLSGHRPRTPPPPPLPIDVEAEVPSPPPDGSSAFGFRQIEASHQHLQPANFDPPSSPRSPLLASSQSLKDHNAVVNSGPSLPAPCEPIFSASTPAFSTASEVVLPSTDETNRTIVSESDPSTGSLYDSADASKPTLSSSPEIEHRS
ncbi:vacuolar protein sorting-associated protein 54 [Lentinula lateritia]|nr:vacuolar protein sorting-associated protein 54 [Lentinula lateritia]